MSIEIETVNAVWRIDGDSLVVTHDTRPDGHSSMPDGPIGVVEALSPFFRSEDGGIVYLQIDGKTYSTGRVVNDPWDDVKALAATLNRRLPPAHYAFCRDADCAGCLPTDADLDAMPLIALWAEMNQRCIAQTHSTKTRDGALAAIRADAPTYLRLAREQRAKVVHP